MPPKRSAVQLRALADDPAAGWAQTPVASQAHQGFLSAPYLSAFLKHHEMPTAKEAMDGMNGARLWQDKQPLVPAELQNESKIAPGAIVVLTRAFNHGFAAPVRAQEQLLTFLRAQPVEFYGQVTEQLRTHYELCRAFRLPESDLASPPSYLDLFKDERVRKTWRSDGAFESVLLNANSLLRVWPGLMAPGWDAVHAPRDAARCWEVCSGDVEALHKDIEDEGPAPNF